MRRVAAIVLAWIVVGWRVGCCDGFGPFRWMKSGNYSAGHDAARWVKLRSGSGSKTALWCHQGVIRNSANGEVVAGIEGVEIIQQLTPLSYLSKKVFVYVDRRNTSSPLTSFRKQRLSPARLVSPVKVIEEKVTFSPDANGINATITWPGGRALRSSAVTIREEEQGMVSTHSVSAASPLGRFGRWISFSSPAMASHGRSHEQYYLSLRRRWLPYPRELVRIAYRRYGESPSWMAVGKGCLVETEATRLSSASELPREVRAAIAAAQPHGLAELETRRYDMEAFNAATDLLEHHRPWYSRLSQWSSSLSR